MIDGMQWPAKKQLSLRFFSTLPYPLIVMMRGIFTSKAQRCVVDAADRRLVQLVLFCRLLKTNRYPI
ncbi:MAG: hypothetical protein CL693_05950 [Cellvibrionaceae bacterium]|nr:hypothetical protein [Cellvibrionaceae bacterium]